MHSESGCTCLGDSESAGKGILSAVMSRITGNADKASGAPAASNGKEAKQGEDAQKKSVPELQASLPHVATRHVPTMTTADNSPSMPLCEQACIKAEHVSFAVFAHMLSVNRLEYPLQHMSSVCFLLNIAHGKHEAPPRYTAYHKSACATRERVTATAALIQQL